MAVSAIGPTGTPATNEFLLGTGCAQRLVWRRRPMNWEPGSNASRFVCSSSRRRFLVEPAVDGIARQLARSGPSVSANYHSARRARSRAEFIARLTVVLDEADEAVGWCEVLQSAELASGPDLDWLSRQAGELRAIFSQSVMTGRANDKRRQQ